MDCVPGLSRAISMNSIRNMPSPSIRHIQICSTWLAPCASAETPVCRLQGCVQNILSLTHIVLYTKFSSHLMTQLALQLPTCRHVHLHRTRTASSYSYHNNTDAYCHVGVAPCHNCTSHACVTMSSQTILMNMRPRCAAHSRALRLSNTGEFLFLPICFCGLSASESSRHLPVLEKLSEIILPVPPRVIPEGGAALIAPNVAASH